MPKPTSDLFDFDANDELSRVAAAYCSATDNNCQPYVTIIRPDGNFRGPSRFVLNHDHLPKGASFTLTPDGMGTKPGIIDHIGGQKVAGNDIIAMTVPDCNRTGAKGLLFTNVLDLRTSGEPGSPQRQAAIDLYAGLYEAAMESGITLFNGESAIMGSYVGSEFPNPTAPFLWAGVGVGMYREDCLIDGSRVAQGQYVVAVKERGIRCNGTTDVRAAFTRRFGNTWWEHPDAQEWIKAAAVPSMNYCKLLDDANGWNPDFEQIDISYIAHITGGGIEDKFGQDAILRLGFNALLHDLYEPLPIMRACKGWLEEEMPNKRAYRSNNGGQGLLVVCDSQGEADRFTRLAERHGKDARICGWIGKKTDNPRLTIISKYDGETFSYERQ